MAGKRIQIITFHNVFTDPITVKIDCFEWKLRVAQYNKNTATINGQPLDSLGSFTNAAKATDMIAIDFGGHVDGRGKPINYNDQLVFANFGGVALFASVILIYLDETLPDPDGAKLR